jgi:hypothetical protein
MRFCSVRIGQNFAIDLKKKADRQADNRIAISELIRSIFFLMMLFACTGDHYINARSTIYIDYEGELRL